MRSEFALGAVLVAAVALVTGFTATRADGPATVYAAASLTDVFPKVSPSSRFQFAGSNQLALQISRGAPADVFASASPVYTQGLFRDGARREAAHIRDELARARRPALEPGEDPLRLRPGQAARS